MYVVVVVVLVQCYKKIYYTSDLYAAFKLAEKVEVKKSLYTP